MFKNKQPKKQPLSLAMDFCISTITFLDIFPAMELINYWNLQYFIYEYDMRENRFFNLLMLNALNQLTGIPIKINSRIP